MKNNLLKIATISFILMLSSCVSSHIVGNSAPAVVLGQANFTYNRVAKGQYSKRLSIVDNLFSSKNGITEMIERAKQDMRENYPLKANQVFTNIIVNIETTNFFLYTNFIIEVKADIIEFTK